MEKFNGWTNYATWRVNLEIFDGFNPYEYYSAFCPSHVSDLADGLKQYAEEVIFDCADIPSGLAKDYALAFLSDVNWHEIAERIIADCAEEAEAA